MNTAYAEENKTIKSQKILVLVSQFWFVIAVLGRWILLRSSLSQVFQVGVNLVRIDHNVVRLNRLLECRSGLYRALADGRHRYESTQP